MEQKGIVDLIKSCGDLFYQNREQEAYQMLQTLLAPVNQILQNMVTSGIREQEALEIMKDFLDAFQRKDQLALADILHFRIPEMIEEMEDAYLKRE